MSVKVMTRVWDHSRTEGNTRLVMLALADHADHDGWTFLGIESIAAKCRVSERTVQRAINEAEVLGELYRILGGAGAGTFTRYLVMPEDNDGDELGIVGDNPQQGRQSVTHKGDKNASVRVTNRANKGDTVVARTKREPYEPRGAGETSPQAALFAIPMPSPDEVSRQVAKIRNSIRAHPANGPDDVPADTEGGEA